MKVFRDLFTSFLSQWLFAAALEVFIEAKVCRLLKHLIWFVFLTSLEATLLAARHCNVARSLLKVCRTITTNAFMMALKWFIALNGHQHYSEHSGPLDQRLVLSFVFALASAILSFFLLQKFLSRIFVHTLQQELTLVAVIASAEIGALLVG